MKTITKNTLIGGLLAIVFVMAIGYAAFSTILNINGTASAAVSWKVYIESITPGSTTGNAQNIDASVGDGNLSAVFQSNLESPEDSITYTIKVVNKGSIDAKLESMDFIEKNNQKVDGKPVIKYSHAGIKKDDFLAAGADKIFTVTVSFNEDLANQNYTQGKIASTLMMKLNYVSNE